MSKRSSLKEWVSSFVPGLVTGASDDDPSGIATYTQVGAHFGLGLLWTTMMNLPFMIATQEMVSRIGMVTGRGLVASIRRHYAPWVVWMFISLVFVANAFNIGADLGAMAEATRLIVPEISSKVLLLFFSATILLLEIFVTYKKYAKILTWLAISLFAYVITALLVTTSWTDVLHATFIPSIQFDRDFVLAIIAITGTTISPYLFIWESNQEVEQEISMGRTTVAKRRGATAHEIKEMRFGVVNGMAVSQLITFCIIVTAAMTFFRNGLFQISTTAEAAQALRPLAGNFASLLFALGVVGTGLLAVPVLAASSSYAVTEALGWSNGLYKKFRNAHGFYGVITLSTVIGLLMNFLSIDPVKALYWTAILNGVVAPPLVAVILVVANDRRIMGAHVNGRLANIVGGATFIVMAASLVLFAVL